MPRLKIILKVDGKFQFGHYKEFTPMNMFSEELKLGIQSGMYEYKIGGGWAFQSANTIFALMRLSRVLYAHLNQGFRLSPPIFMNLQASGRSYDTQQKKTRSYHK